MTDAAKIARGLTKAQRDGLQELGDGAALFPGSHSDLLDLWLAGLVACNSNTPERQVYPTQKGLAVRAELERIADE